MKSEIIAERIVTALEGRFRDWLMSGEHAEAVELVGKILSEGCGEARNFVMESLDGPSGTVESEKLARDAATSPYSGKHFDQP